MSGKGAKGGGFLSVLGSGGGGGIQLESAITNVNMIIMLPVVVIDEPGEKR